MRARAFALVGFLIALNAAAWLLALGTFWSHPVLLGTALLAFSFGLRHAVDADHICAIDNVTRKLVQERRRPIGVGFFFSLGHSTVVVALSLAIAVSATVVKDHLPSLQRLGALVGSSVSAFFLLLVAAINLVVLLEIFAAFSRARRGETPADDALDEMFDRRGLLGRIFRPLLRVVDRSWKMYPVGVLFGLGFDTATEVALLGIAAVEAGKGLPVFAILIFPLLFTAGMALIDTADGIVMVRRVRMGLHQPDAQALLQSCDDDGVSARRADRRRRRSNQRHRQPAADCDGGVWDAIKARSTKTSGRLAS